MGSEKTNFVQMNISEGTGLDYHTSTYGRAINIATKKLPYILESNPHPFYSFRGLKKNQMRIRFAIESWILEK
jgi:hypothetical protein